MAAQGEGLSEEQLVTLGAEVAAGRFPRVRLAGSAAGAATAGTVRKVGDPALDGEDFVTVRVRINGVVDDLRFAPRELSHGRRGRAPAEPLSRRAEAAPAPRARRPRRPVGASKEAETSSTATAPTRAPAVQAGPRRTARRVSPTAPVSIVLSSVDAFWTVSAHRGSRSILKNAAVNPGVVSAIASLLGQSSLDEAVAAVNDTARTEAETRAEQLRAELAQIQAVLDSHRRPGPNGQARK